MRNSSVKDRSPDEMADDEKHYARLTLLHALPDRYWRFIKARDEVARQAFEAVAAWFAGLRGERSRELRRHLSSVVARSRTDPADLPPVESRRVRSAVAVSRSEAPAEHRPESIDVDDAAGSPGSSR
jgi:hypothetical protein